MASAWKYIKWTILGITGLFLALVVFLFLWIDPNDYRDDITTLVKDKTGLVLTIKGDIGWNFYPALGFSVGDLALATAEGENPLASVKKAAVSVELLPLFSKQVNVRTLFVDGLVANLVVDENGKGNWEALTAGGEQAPEPVPEEPAGEAVLVTIPKVVVTNTIIDYDDRKGGSHYTVNVTELAAEDVGLQREMPIHLVASVQEAKGLKVGTDMRAFVRLDTDAQLYNVRGLELTADVTGILAKPFRAVVKSDISADMKAQRILANNFALEASDLALGGQPVTATVGGPMAIDLVADSANVGPLAFSAAGVSGTLKTAVTALTRELAYSGTLDVAPFNAKHVMRQFGIAPPNTTDAAALTRVALKTDFEGALTRAALSNLAITLDDTHIKGSAALNDLATQAIAFDLAIDAINADRYLPPAAKPAAGGDKAAAAPAAATKPAGKPEPLLPVDTLRKLNVDGKLSAGRITIMEWPATNLVVGVLAKDGDIHVNPVSATVLEGTVRGDVRVDARGAEPRIVTRLKLDKVEVGGIVKRYAGRDLFSGKTSLNLDMDATGNDIDTLMKKAVGGLDVSFADSVLKGMNINNLLTESLTQQLGAFAMLVPDYQQKLPKELQQDTSFQTLAAGAKIKDGIAQIPAFNAAVKDGGMKGGGQFNLVTKDFDYTIAMRTTKLDDSKYFKGAEFPIHCKGNIAGAPADWCRPDTKAIGNMLKKAAENAAKDRLKGELAEKLGIDTVDTKALKAQAEQQAQQRLDEEKKKAEQKAKEELNKQMNKALQKFL